ncbi:unnamed protein product [Gongylonema pulchrum]|uniref:Acyl carrier protein n=1 Tax=Gongylonema pulchrum TaxID=637853 RepID=A0A183DML2_9BILA|nr:unnamed protein product [Gongylonema pulchrum]
MLAQMEQIGGVMDSGRLDEVVLTYLDELMELRLAEAAKEEITLEKLIELARSCLYEIFAVHPIQAPKEEKTPEAELTERLSKICLAETPKK